MLSRGIVAAKRAVVRGFIENELVKTHALPLGGEAVCRAHEGGAVSVRPDIVQGAEDLLSNGLGDKMDRGLHDPDRDLRGLGSGRFLSGGELGKELDRAFAEICLVIDRVLHVHGQPGENERVRREQCGVLLLTLVNSLDDRGVHDKLLGGDGRRFRGSGGNLCSRSRGGLRHDVPRTARKRRGGEEHGQQSDNDPFHGIDLLITEGELSAPS